MRIAIDIRTLNAPKTGDRSVCLGHIKGLAALAEKESLELILIGPQAPPEGLLPSSPALHFHPASRPGGYLWMLRAFPKACQAVQADVALIQYMGPLQSPCPFVTIIHDVVWRSLPQTFPLRDRLILNAFIPGTIRRAAAIVTVSQFSAHEIVRHYPAAKGRLYVVPNAADERFYPVAESGILSEVRHRYQLPARYILSVGVLQPRKNFEGLLQAYSLLPVALQEQFPLVIAGKPGWRVAPILQQAQQMGSRVRLVGYVADEDLPALYSMAACFVYPSFYEGFGLPPLEAMACGAPVIVSNAASLPEVCGDAAMYVDPYSPAQISAALQKILTNEPLRQQLSQKGLNRARQFDWQSSARLMWHILQQASRMA